MTRATFKRWQPLDLWLEEIGPFRQGLEHFSFRGPAADGGGKAPANLYLLLAPNAQGKTTVLEAVFGLFGLLANPPTGRFSDPSEFGRAQLDVRATWVADGAEQTVLLSVWTGSETPLRSWTPAEIQSDAEASSWGKLGLGRNAAGVFPLDATDELGLIFYRSVTEGRGEQPSALAGASQDLPTVLFFPADRTIVAPVDQRSITRPLNFGYQPAQKFGSDGPDWDGSIDNLLVWLEWLDDGRITDLIEFLNGNLFADEASKAMRRPNRNELLTYIESSTGSHTLSRLSQGERALLQFYVRTLCHMTLNTIILMDEVENHLHVRWMQRLVAALKTMLRQEGRFVTVIFTTHNMELMQTFQHDVVEPGITKGGHLIEEGMR